MRVGIMSLAHSHAYGYARALSATPGVELITADDDGRTIDGVQAASSYRELLASKPDAVVVCAENTRHRALVEQAAAAGAAVLCEKPLATTLADATAMIEACERAAVPLMVAYPVRFAPSMVRLRQLVRDGDLGRVLACTGTNNGRLPGGWFTDPELAGGGAVLDHTVHLADLLLWMLDAPPVSVYAQTNRILHRDRSEVETGGLLVVTFADGTVATIDCSWSRPDGYPTWGGLTLQVAGTTGTATVDAFPRLATGYAATPLWLGAEVDLDGLLIEEFLAVARGERPPAPDGTTGLRTLEIALAAYDSARTGQPVELPLPA